MITFEGWPKTARLNKGAVYTEKIDGTNGAVIIEKYDVGLSFANPDPIAKVVVFENEAYLIAAQSRNRLIQPGNDNAGFARWVWDNAAGLVQVLGEGRHFGEWWGHGIQRGYGLAKGDRRFSLFNTKRWTTDELQFGINPELRKVPGLGIVPVLAVKKFSTSEAARQVDALRTFGSVAAEGFPRPEGVCVFHTASQTVYKTFLENDEIPKGRV